MLSVGNTVSGECIAAGAISGSPIDDDAAVGAGVIHDNFLIGKRYVLQLVL
jgi:hypothetical protein